MALESVSAIVDALRGTPLLKPAGFEDVRKLAATQSDPQEFARTLIRLKYLNLYQAKKILAGKVDELVMGHYVVFDKLGEGGMGKVYKAVQLNLDRTVALKVVRTSLLKNETALRRFRREVKSAAQLSHPNIVRVFDADQDGDRHYLAMEYIDGADMSRLVKDHGALPVHVACSYIRQAAMGLQHAHDQGLVHRDIKPSNLLVVAGEKRQYGPRNLVKILDMGLARSTVDETGDNLSTELTRTGTVVGTPDYMSPEQAKNSSAVDHRSDLYSLGCTFYHLLTGEVVFPNGNPLEKLLQHQMDAPRPIQLVRMETPAEVASIVQSLLAKKPEHRFQSGAALAHALEPWCSMKGGSDLHPTTILAAEAVDPSSTTIETKPGSPFDFDDLGETTPPPTPRKGPPTQKRPAFSPEGDDQQPTRPKWIVFAAAGVVCLVLLAIVIGLLSKPKPNIDDSSPNADPPSTKTKTDTKKTPEKTPEKTPAESPAKDLDSIERFIPNETASLVVFDLRELRNVPLIRDKILPDLGRRLQAMVDPVGAELMSKADRVVIANTVRDDDTVTIFQGRKLVTPKLLEQARESGETKTSRLADGVTDLFEFRIPPEGGSTGEPTTLFAVAIDASVVVSRSRDRVMDAFDKREGTDRRTRLSDPTILPGLVNTSWGPKSYPVRASLGLRSGGLRFVGTAQKVDSASAAVDFTDRGMEFHVVLQESESGSAAALYKEMMFFLGLKALGDPQSRMLYEVLNLAKTPPIAPKKGNLVHWRTIVQLRRVEDWIKAFFGTGKT
jgi:eukaryotic-like serine/threonine-protein kinase